jgi:hypothetical protein
MAKPYIDESQSDLRCSGLVNLSNGSFNLSNGSVDMKTHIKFVAAWLALAVTMAGTSSLSYAQTGTVRIHVAKAGFIVGVGGGEGVLRFKGKSYRLHVGGVSLGTIGVASADMVGRAYNLRHAADIVGTYSAVAGSIAVAAGVKAARIQNAKGVVLDLEGRQAGFEASLSLSGMNISFR